MKPSTFLDWPTWIGLAVLLMSAPSAAPVLAGSQGRPLLVSAASSLTNVVEEVATAFERDTGTVVELNFGSSSSLSRQIVEGAPVDLFLSANVVQMDLVARAGALMPGTRVDLLSNQLVLVVPGRQASALLAVTDLLNPSVRRIGIGDPAAVPIGVYAREFLESVGLWQALHDKLVPMRNVRAVLSVVESGNVDAGFVYRTDARLARRARVALAIPVSEGPAIVYPVAILRRTRDASAARQLLAYLKGATARDMFERSGFVVLGPADPRSRGPVDPGS